MIQDQINSLQEKRDALVLEKRTLETSLQSIKNLVRSSGRMEHYKYKTCCESQASYTQKILKVEQKLLPIKAELRRLELEKNAAKQLPFNGVGGRELVHMLREVRDKWQEFSCDDSLGNSTERTQASQFVRDLNPILHALIDP